MSEKIRYIVREAQEGRDENRLAQILSECFAPPITSRQVNRWLRQAKQNPLGSKTFVCEFNGEIVSQVGIDFKSLHVGEGIFVKTGGIAGVCTYSDYRRKGIMTNLMQQSLTYIRNSGVSTSALYTGLVLPAHRIYQRCGFCDIQTWPAYIKFSNFPYFFQTWVRGLNRHLKFSKIGQKTLKDWSRSVIFELENVGIYAFRFKGGRFQRLVKPPKTADIIIKTTVETFIRVMWGAIKMEDAIKTGKIQVQKGSEADLQILRKILLRLWDE